MLARLADYLEARQALADRFTGALVYPVLVAIIAFAVIAVLLAWVVPQVVSVYEQGRQTLPWLTRALIATSAFMRATAWMWLALAVVAAVAFALAMRRDAVPRRRAPHAARDAGDSAGCCAASTPRASPRRSRSSSRAARRCCARSTPRRA